jgi:5-methylcytosine-specific restriction endonuclease McrA
MPMNKSDYPANWPKVSRTIRRIAGNRCEWCGVPNGVPLPSGREGCVVLTVAHLGAPIPTGSGWKPGDKHDKHDVRRENLAALCQSCHLRFDQEDHIVHARHTRQRKKRESLLVAGQLVLPLPVYCTALLKLEGHAHMRKEQRCNP